MAMIGPLAHTRLLLERII